MTINKITIFKNDRAGQPIKKKDGSIIEFNGKALQEPDLKGIISIAAENLPVGEYEVGIYKNVSKKGNTYYSGKIKPAFKPNNIDEHNQAKGNGYQPDNIVDDEVPF